MGVKLVGVLPRKSYVMFHGSLMLLAHGAVEPLLYDLNDATISDTLEDVIKRFTRSVREAQERDVHPADTMLDPNCYTLRPGPARKNKENGT